MKLFTQYKDMMQFYSNFSCIWHTNIFLVNKNQLFGHV